MRKNLMKSLPKSPMLGSPSASNLKILVTVLTLAFAFAGFSGAVVGATPASIPIQCTSSHTYTGSVSISGGWSLSYTVTWTTKPSCQMASYPSEGKIGFSGFLFGFSMNQNSITSFTPVTVYYYLEGTITWLGIPYTSASCTLWINSYGNYGGSCTS